MGWRASSIQALRAAHKSAIAEHRQQMRRAADDVAEDLEVYARGRTRWQSGSGQQRKKIVGASSTTTRKARMFLRGLPTKSKWGTHNVLASLEFGTRPHRIWARKAPKRFGKGQSYSAVGARALAFGGRLVSHVNHPGTRPYMTLRGSWQASSRTLPNRFGAPMRLVAQRFGR